MPPTSDRYAALDEAARDAAGQASPSAAEQARSSGTEQLAQEKEARAAEAAKLDELARVAKRSADAQVAFSEGGHVGQSNAAWGMIRDHHEMREAATPGQSQEPAGDIEQPRKLGFFEDHTSLKLEHAEALGKETKDADQEQKQGQGDGRSLTFYEDRNPTDPLTH
jgi:hypothetical protein